MSILKSSEREVTPITFSSSLTKKNHKVLAAENHGKSGLLQLLCRSEGQQAAVQPRCRKVCDDLPQGENCQRMRCRPAFGSWQGWAETRSALVVCLICFCTAGCGASQAKAICTCQTKVLIQDGCTAHRQVSHFAWRQAVSASSASL